MEAQLQQPQQEPPPPYTERHIQSGQSCCGGQSERFNIKAGKVTGILQLVFGILTIALPLIPFALTSGVHWYPGLGDAPATAVFVFIPAGILGICSKSRSNCVIIAYLVMSILAAIGCFGVVAYESTAASIYSYSYECYGWICGWEVEPGAVALHALSALVGVAELVVAIVASVYCCRGLYCCRSGCNCDDGVVSNSTATTTVYYNTTPQQAGIVNEVQVVKF